uniref:uncharacterized protein LOC127070925 isoform X2 n=1 Tax=Vespula vulgaris TaxID=7454 RepID=UPI00223B2B75|nr:uncharacterized protein LOC127070925 isoform X2 [Vespula vulgaris]
MTEKSKTKSRVYLAGKESTVKAVELLQSRLNNRKRSWDNKDNDKSHKMTHRCTSMPLQKKSDYVSLTGFSKSLLMLEVRSHLEICVGNHRLNDRKELEKLLLLQSKNFANS